MPASSTRPNSREVPRCEQWSANSPSLPALSRKRTSSSPSNLTLIGCPFGVTDSVKPTGHQYRLSISPAGVPGLTRVSNSFSSLDNIDLPPDRSTVIVRIHLFLYKLSMYPL